MKENRPNNTILLLGSNIDPEKNIFSALDLLGKIKNKSRVWKTKSYGSKGPDFLNMAVEVETALDRHQLKESVIGCIERALRRTRTENKYAPRTIDIDIIVFNEQVKDPEVWEKAFVAIPVAELRPNLLHPNTGETLMEIAEKLKSAAGAELFA